MFQLKDADNRFIIFTFLRYELYLRYMDRRVEAEYLLVIFETISLCQSYILKFTNFGGNQTCKVKKSQ